MRITYIFANHTGYRNHSSTSRSLSGTITPFVCTCNAGQMRSSQGRVRLVVAAFAGMVAAMNVLLIGDVVGRPGREALSHWLPRLRQTYDCDFCIVNGENAAGSGNGITRSCVSELTHAGADAITTGDHIFDQKQFVKGISLCPTVLRPANYPPSQPGQTYRIFTASDGSTVAVFSLVGRVFMARPGDNPFVAADRMLEEIGKRAQSIIVDIHAEATSEKIALGRHLDGRVTTVFGTHTHVPTADAQVFPGGTAYITDLGMVGGRRSVLGRDPDAVIRSFRTGLPTRFGVVQEDIVLCGAVVECDPQTGRATRISRVQRDFPA
jgi:metallophosphoesterase (TIGR00282 family)